MHTNHLTHSGRNLIDPSLQDNVLIRTISSSTFIMSDVQSVNIPSSIQDGYWEDKNLSKRQAVICLLVDPVDKEHKEPDKIDLEAPRLAQYMHKAWKKHQNTVYGVDIRFVLKKGLKFCQTRSNSIIFYNTLTAFCIRRLLRSKLEKSFSKKYLRHPNRLQRFP